MEFQNKTTFFHVWEEKLWGDRVDANDYFSSLSAWITMIVAAVPICVGFFSSMDFNPQILLRGVETGIGAILFLWLFNVAESIIACKEVSVIIKRSLLLLLVLTCACALGVLLSIVIIAIVCIVLGIIVLYFVIGILNGSLNMPSRSSGSKDPEEDDHHIWHNGWVSGTKTLSDEFEGNDGHTYRHTGMGTHGWERVN